MQSAKLRLIADIGGTRTRFGLSRSGGHPERIRVFDTADCESVVHAVACYLDDLRERPEPVEALFAVASPVTGDRVELTNCPWGFSIEDTRRELGLERLSVVNDVEALAAALPYVEVRDLGKLGGEDTVENAPRAVIAPGTGLGMAGLIPFEGRWLPLASEGGHVSFAAEDETEFRLWRTLARRFGHVSAERLISGPGLVSIYGVLAEVAGKEPEVCRPEDVTERATAKEDSLCAEAVRLFTALLGSVAGDLVLTLGARGGLYIGGGIVRDLGSDFDVALFRDRFAAKGRLSSYLEPIPAYVVQHEYPALLGAAHLSLEES